MSHPNRRLRIQIEPALAGVRLDKALSQLLPDYSRALIQRWLKQDLVRLDGRAVAQKFRLAGGETLEVSVPEAWASDVEAQPAQPVEIEIIDQDADLLVINKPAGMVVHPGAGHADRTLLNGLLHFDESLRALPRAGIVHRLDKDTSGVLVVARNEAARRQLIEQLRARGMKRRYLAVVNGVPVSGERIDQPVGRHRHDRLRMRVTPSGKPAVTHVRVERKFRHHSLLRADLETGRTHQIRVHLSWRGFPVVGDKRYGERVRLPPGAGFDLTAALRQLDRHALHAARLELRHPRSGEPRQWRQPMPADLQHLVEILENDRREHRRRGG
ncbi:MAG: RluA family pseudouridine synthase [Gammaproteobacteria bacterium]|nr:RluA family pseudouridine synthase [Gammaproteobacteria bacterium]